MKDVNILTSNGINVQQSLELFGDMEMYDETLTDFLDLIDEKITKLETEKASGDMPNYAIDVHSLKSDARYLGFATLADLAYQSEMKSKASDVNFVNENHPKIIAETNRILAVAQQYMGRPVTVVGSTQAAPVAPVPTATPTPAPAPMAQQVQTAPTAQMVAPSPVAPSPQVAPMPQAVQTVQQAPVAQVAPAAQAVPTMQTVAPGPMAQPVQAAPTAQMVAPTPVAPAPQTTPLAQAVPTMQTVAPAPVETETDDENTIQFFTPTPNNSMDQALFNMQQAAPTANAVNPIKKGIILVIDDSKLVANFVKKIFSGNYDVLTAADGKQGIEIINDPNVRSQIKTCLLDLNMPNMNGFEVMDYFREQGIFVKTPVAVISGAEDVESIDKANTYPIIDILAKPFNERDVQKVVEKCLAAYF